MSQIPQIKRLEDTAAKANSRSASDGVPALVAPPLALQPVLAQLHDEEVAVRVAAAANLDRMAAHDVGAVVPLIPQLLEALHTWDDPDTTAALRQVLERIAQRQVLAFDATSDQLRRTLFDSHNASARAFAAQTLARLMITQRRVRPEIWNDLVTAIEHQVSSHHVGDMLVSIHLLVRSPLARQMEKSIRELVTPFLDHWKPEVRIEAHEILQDLDHLPAFPEYLRHLKEHVFSGSLDELSDNESTAPTSEQKYVPIRQIIQQPLSEQLKLFRRLLPPSILTYYAIDEETLRTAHGDLALHVSADVDAGLVELSLWRNKTDIDPAMLLNFGETANGQINVYLVVVNNLYADRYNIDYDDEGRPTLLGLVRRNLGEEARALHAGLSPGQVRPGLGLVVRRLLPTAEKLLLELGKQYIFAQPLAYHNAILLERWGFIYLTGQRFMEALQARFTDGDLRAALDGSTFRPPDAWRTVRGRSWAIHDGILGEPWPELHMVRRLDKPGTIDTFPGGPF